MQERQYYDGKIAFTFTMLSASAGAIAFYVSKFKDGGIVIKGLIVVSIVIFVMQMILTFRAKFNSVWLLAEVFEGKNKWMAWVWYAWPADKYMVATPEKRVLRNIAWYAQIEDNREKQFFDYGQREVHTVLKNKGNIDEKPDSPVMLGGE